jgi:erythromycin esterase
MGEVTHGTREFCLTRHRLLRYLVEELGFNTLAIEASYSAAEIVNDYVLAGIGDRSAALTQLGYIAWDVEEFADVLDWLRSYNQAVGPADRVRFWGLDITNTRLGRQKVLEYLRIVDPDMVAPVRGTFQQVNAAEERGVLISRERVSQRLVLEIHRLLDVLLTRRDAFVRQTSSSDYEEVVHLVKVIWRWASLRAVSYDNLSRSSAMAENVRHLLGRAPQARIVLWAHNFHVSTGWDDPERGALPNMGHYLRDWYGERYYALGFELDHGTYLARTGSLEAGVLGGLFVGQLSGSPEESLPWYLSNAGVPNLMVSIRGGRRSPHVEDWLTRPHLMHAVGWLYYEPPIYTHTPIKNRYDGIVFIEESSPTTPTANALTMVSEGLGH